MREAASASGQTHIFDKFNIKCTFYIEHVRNWRAGPPDLYYYLLVRFVSESVIITVCCNI